MRTLTGAERDAALPFMAEALSVAAQSLCHRGECGAVLVGANGIIGRGFNGPPGNVRLNVCFKPQLPKDFKSDRNCCIHAEDRAVRSALAAYPGEVPGSRMYFARSEGGEPFRDNVLYCTICSKLLVDARVGEFVMWEGKDLVSYPAAEMNTRSFGLPYP